MKTFLIIMLIFILSFGIGIFIFESKSVYNEVMAYNFFKMIREKKFKRAFNITRLIFGKKIRAYLLIELVKALLLKNRIEQAYYIYKRSNNPLVKMSVLELIIDNCIKNNDLRKVEAFTTILCFYDNKKLIDTYKKILNYYEKNNEIEKIRDMEKMYIENLDFYIALSYIKLGSLEDIERMILTIENPKKIGLLVYETFKFYRESDKLEELNIFYNKVKFDKVTQGIIDEFLIKIFIEQKDFDKANEKILNLEPKKQFDFYLLIAKELKDTPYIDLYINKAYGLIKYFNFPTEKVMALIKISYLTIKEDKFKFENRYLDEAYEIYLETGSESLDLSKEFILLFRQYKRYELFMELLEKKAKIYKEVINMDNMNEIKPEFIKSINIFLWGEELKTFEDFMKSYNIVQLKNGDLDYQDFYDLIHQIKRYVNDETYENINNISKNLSDKPNTLFFINQYLRILKES